MLSLLFTQARLAAGASGLPERRPTLGTILPHPAGHALPDNAKLASNLRLVLPSLPQLNGLKASFLQGMKIAWYSSSVSHIQLHAAYPFAWVVHPRDFTPPPDGYAACNWIWETLLRSEE